MGLGLGLWLGLLLTNYYCYLRCEGDRGEVSQLLLLLLLGVAAAAALLHIWG